ncbi:phosphoribosylformimino-5-aminoimidazole carboxamide ribotide isomerase [Halioxenophilus aromaticivorans]|uniref:5-proFAR isomerase n=1 Tax=Halioxenophilus aromaticivorans TaxID=1306992 RepID=A0AAV3U1Y8_9ALTE
MTQFRPCIDLHAGKVKQIVGGSLTDAGATTNFVSAQGADYFANLYRQHGLQGGHVIGLGPGNEEQAKLALNSWPKGLQYGGGINLENAKSYLDAGASHVIVTSFLFSGGVFSLEKLNQMVKLVGAEHLVLDLSCRRTDQGWNIATDRWQTVTGTAITPALLEQLASQCSEFLVHAADVEGLQQGIDEALVSLLGKHSPIAATYAGGATGLDDLEKVKTLSNGRVDLTIGSALDIFGGSHVTLAQCIAWNQANGQ